MTDDESVLAPVGGWAAVPNSVARSPKLSAAAKLVYLSISSRINFPAAQHPSHATMAVEASCSVATVKRALNELKAARVVEWRHQGNGKGGQGNNAYRLIVTPAFETKSDAGDVPF
jgi:DNA-binding transcriptional MocR family regulator